MHWFHSNRFSKNTGMNWRVSLAILIAAIACTAGCDAPVQKRAGEDPDQYSGQFLDANRYMLERNHDRIEAFVNRAGWDMQETPSGLWYMITRSGNGRKTLEGYFVSYAYTTRLLDGTFIYEADTTSPRNIVLGKGNIESGLEEGLGMLRGGDRARFIIPPYLGHGNFGDRDRITGSAILLVEVEVLDVRR
jgi:FKBP-type peptidyl-prolyl cis-trans isomerase